MHTVRPFYIRSGVVWQESELAALRRFIVAVGKRFGGRVEELVVLELPLADLYGRHWSLTGDAVPDAASPDEAVYLPGRNATIGHQGRGLVPDARYQKIGDCHARFEPISRCHDRVFQELSNGDKRRFGRENRIAPAICAVEQSRSDAFWKIVAT